MLHEPAAPEEKDNASAYKMRLGVRMFWLYAIVYASFIAINVIKPVIMERIIVFGLNLAIVYGFGPILFALFLALIYDQMCSREEKARNHTDAEEEKA